MEPEAVPKLILIVSAPSFTSLHSLGINKFWTSHLCIWKRRAKAWAGFWATPAENFPRLEMVEKHSTAVPATLGTMWSGSSYIIHITMVMNIRRLCGGHRPIVCQPFLNIARYPALLWILPLLMSPLDRKASWAGSALNQCKAATPFDLCPLTPQEAVVELIKLFSSANWRDLRLGSATAGLLLFHS